MILSRDVTAQQRALAELEERELGFRTGSRHLVDAIQFVGYAFQIEMKFRAYLKKFKLQEVSIVFTDREKGESKMSKTIIWEAVFGVISMKIRSLFRKNGF